MIVCLDWEVDGIIRGLEFIGRFHRSGRDVKLEQVPQNGRFAAPRSNGEEGAKR
jgi:hypothetical protein